MPSRAWNLGESANAVNVNVSVGTATLQATNGLIFNSTVNSVTGQLLVGTTTSPAGLASNLVVNGSMGGGIELVNNNSGGGNISALNGGGLSISTFTGSVGSESYSQRMVINSSGLVGIGTNNPTAKLSVSGGSMLIGNGNGYRLGDVGGVGSSAINAQGDDNVVYYNANAVPIWSATNSSQPSAVFGANSSNRTVYTAISNSIQNITNGVTRMVIDGSGNVGIGTTSPQYGLHVIGNNFVSGSSWTGNLAITATTASTSSATGALTVAGGMGVGGNIIVSSTGNVGIGTATPSSSLSVYGTSTLAGTASSIAALFTNSAEVVNIQSAALVGNITCYLANAAVFYYTANASGNWNVNISHSTVATLNSIMSVGQSTSLTLITTQGTTAYWSGNITVDGSNSNVLTRWQAPVPTSGHSNSLDVYTYTVIKTAATPTYTVLAGQGQYILNFSYTISYLVVAGGAGGGTNGGGGGAGGLLTGTSTVSAGTAYTISVGAGGSGGAAGTYPSGSNGNNSSAFSNTATGGGAGGGAGSNGSSGGSGGGGGWGLSATSGGSGTAGQGNAGGSGSTGASGAGGGGGAGAAGGNDGGSTTGGAGGAGSASSITGTSTYYAGGGGGGGDITGGAAGSGGGGSGGGGSNAPGSAATANTGGGGGGGGAGSTATGGNGGSGIIIISYANATQIGTGGTVTSYTSGSTTYWVHTFTTSGTYTA